MTINYAINQCPHEQDNWTHDTANGHTICPNQPHYIGGRVGLTAQQVKSCLQTGSNGIVPSPMHGPNSCHDELELS